MPEYYVGLDVHSKHSTFVVQTAAGKVAGRGEVPTTFAGLEELRNSFQLPSGTTVALETGTTAFHVARQLVTLGLKPVVIDAHEVRLKAHRPTQKSDRRDALELCEGVRGRIYRSIVHVPDPTIAALRETLSRRRHFVQIKTSEAVAVKRLLRATGWVHLTRTLSAEAGWEKLLSKLPMEGALREHIERHRAVWRCAHEQILALEQELTTLQQPFSEDIRRMQAIPGVGPVVSLTVLAVFSDVTRFPTAKHAASYAGLVPSTQQSGESSHQGHITKRGSGELRSMLCEAAHHARRINHPLNPYFSKLCALRGYKSAIVAVAHRLCRILFAILRDHAEFDVAKLGVELGPFERNTVRLYRLKKAEAV